MHSRCPPTNDVFANGEVILGAVHVLPSLVIGLCAVDSNALLTSIRDAHFTCSQGRVMHCFVGVPIEKPG